jgi:hypothetical protein
MCNSGLKVDYQFTRGGVAIFGVKSGSDNIGVKDLLVAINKNVQCVEALRELIENNK